MIFGVFAIVTSAYAVLTQPDATTISEPSNFLAIPGVNSYLPLSETPEIVLALFIAVVIHELGHAILCKVEGIDIDSSGIAFFSVLPMGAFVEPNEESKDNATPFSRVRMAAAGISTNITLVVISFLVLVLLSSLLIIPAPGAHIGATYDNTSAESQNLTGSQITHINSYAVQNNTQFTTQLEKIPQESITVTTSNGINTTIDRQLTVIQTTNPNINVSNKITAINGINVSTIHQLYNNTQDTELATVTINNQQTKQLPIGAQVTTNDGETKIITEINNIRIKSHKDLQQLTYSQNTTVPVTQWIQTENNSYTKETANISLATIETVYTGVSGVEFTETGLIFYPTETYLGVLQFNSDTINQFGYIGTITLLFIFPLLSIVPGGLSFNFGGFTPEISSAYTTTIGFTEPILFLATLAFWSLWLNINLIIFNSLPIWMLDGHHIVKDTIKGYSDKYNINPKIPYGIMYLISTITLISLLVIVSSPFWM